MSVARVVIGDGPIELSQVVAVARHNAEVALSPRAEELIGRARGWVERMVRDNETVYGVTTGLGDLCQVRIDSQSLRELSERIIMSHACGVGDPLSEEEVRAIMLAQILNFAHGCSGVRVELVRTLINMLNRHVTPWVPSQGSVGYLTHMAHIGLVVIGRGRAYVSGELLPGAQAMDRAGVDIVRLAEKEGLSLVNGTPCMTGLGALTVYDAQVVADWADVSAAMSFEALGGLTDAFDERVQKVRPHAGQTEVATRLRHLVRHSQMTNTDENARIQDPLSLRAIPQVHGACRDHIGQVAHSVTVELNSATDNPLLFEHGSSGLAISACNAHGEPVALAMDQLSIAVSELANISERRQARLVNPQASGLPAFLINDAGLNTGFMITQYVAASLVSENKVLAHPASVDSITTSALQEDHVSMGTSAALKARRIVKNTQKVIALELLSAAQAMDLLQSPGRFGDGSTIAHRLVRKRISFRNRDREFSSDIAEAVALVEEPVPLDIIKRTKESGGPTEI